MLTILLYSLDYAEGLRRELPYLNYFFERSLSELAILRSQDTRVVLVTPTPVDPAVLTYHFRDLWELSDSAERSAYSRLMQFPVHPADGEPLEAALLRDPSRLAILQNMTEGDTAKIVNFAPSQALERLGELIGAGVAEGPHAVAQRWGSKSGSKEMLVRSKVRTPRGSPEVLTGMADVVAACTRLTRDSPHVEQAVVKLNGTNWSAGIGNAVIDCRHLLRTGSLVDSVTSLLQPWDRFAAEIPSGAIVEEYVPGAVCSPSGQGHITDSGDVVIRSTHEQIVDSGQYLGCSFPGPAEFVPDINRAVTQVGRTLASNGVRGSFGVDFVGFANGDLLAVEINVRKVAPTHVLSYVETATNALVEPDGYLRVAGQPQHYLHRRYYEPDVFRFLDPLSAVGALRDRGLLYDRRTRQGAILHILGAVRTCGYVETTCVATRLDLAEELDEQAHSVLVRVAMAQGTNA
jgi:hypothetical protein